MWPTKKGTLKPKISQMGPDIEQKGDKTGLTGLSVKYGDPIKSVPLTKLGTGSIHQEEKAHSSYKI